MADKESNSDKETISRLREALANMNKDYMQTKLELDQMKGAQQQQQKASNDSKSDLGAQFALRFSSRVKQLQSNINTKLATAGIQLNNESAASDVNDNDNNNNNNNHNHNHNHTVSTSSSTTGNNSSNGNVQNSNDASTDSDKSLETRRLRDDIESLQTQMNNLRSMLRQSMEEKEQLQKERNELLIKYGEADEQIKRLKEQSNTDANRYEELLDSFRAENHSQIESEKKKLYKEFDDKLNELSKQYTEYKTKYEQLKAEWDENEEGWNKRFDLVVSERNSLKRKVKSLQNDLCELMRNNGSNVSVHSNANAHSNDSNKSNKSNQSNNNVSMDFEEHEEVKVDRQQSMEIERLRKEMAELRKSHNNEKTTLLANIQRLSSKTAIQSKTSDMQFLVNSLSNLISEKEDIIQSLTESKKFIGHTLLKKEEEIVKLKQMMQNNGKK